jgi:hypothetical protein
MMRPARDYEVFVAQCIDCKGEVESRTTNVPLRCLTCQEKHDVQKEIAIKTKESLKAIANQIEKSRQKPAIIWPEVCKFCLSQRAGIMEGRAFYKCSTIYDHSRKVPSWKNNCQLSSKQ